MIGTGTTFVTKDAITDVNQIGLNGQYKVLAEIALDGRTHYIIRDDDGEGNKTYIIPIEEFDHYSIKVIN